MLHDSYFTLAFFVRKARPLKNGEVPLFVRITVSGQSIEMNIGRSIPLAMWDQKRNMAKGRSKKEMELNKYIEVIRARFSDIHNMLVRENKLVSPQTLRAHYLGTVEKPKMLCDVFRDNNKIRKDEYERGDICKGTYERWKRCVIYLEEFIRLTRDMDDLPIKEADKGFIQDFEHFLRMKKNTSINTTARYMRYLKNTFQFAISHSWVNNDPFIGKRFKRTVANKIFLTEPEVKAIRALDLHAFPRLERVRDTFVFCCFTGLAFIDIQTLKRSDIVIDGDGNKWIHKHREKTGELSTIPLLEIPEAIMDKYKDHPQVLADNVAIPVFSNQRCNSYLKEIADLAKITKHLTTHTARHTFATMSLNNHVPLETISKMLGHSDINTTRIYARLLDSTVYEDMESMREKFNHVV